MRKLNFHYKEMELYECKFILNARIINHALKKISLISSKNLSPKLDKLHSIIMHFDDEIILIAFFFLVLTVTCHLLFLICLAALMYHHRVTRLHVILSAIRFYF